MFAAALLIATGVLAREPSVKGFKSYETPTYTLVTPDDGNAQRVPWPIAQSQAVLGRIFNREASVHGVPTYVFVMPVSVWRRYLQPGQGLDSEFVPGRFANYLLVCNTQYEVLLRETLLHEATHWNLHEQFGGIVPLWFGEGLAQIVAGADFRGAEIALGDRGKSFRDAGGWIPMAELLPMDKTARAYLNLDTNAQVSAESWALVHRGLIFDEKFGKQLFALIAAQNALQPLDSAVQSSLGMTLDQLDRDMSSYNSNNVRLLRFPMTPAPVAPLPEGRVMEEAEALEFIGEVMLATGFKPLRLSEIANAMLRVPEGRYAEFSLRMRIAARDGDDVTLTRLSGAIDQHTIDPAILRGAGLALYERSAETRRDDQSVRALELLDRALKIQPEDTEAVWAYAMLAAQLKRDMPTALDRVAAASARRPSNPYLAQAEALLREAGGDAAGMNAALEKALRLSKTVELTRWARQRLGLAPGK
jgi:tetratricopeptide (TPR) repeat protein